MRVVVLLYWSWVPKMLCRWWLLQPPTRTVSWKEPESTKGICNHSVMGSWASAGATSMSCFWLAQDWIQKSKVAEVFHKCAWKVIRYLKLHHGSGSPSMALSQYFLGQEIRPFNQDGRSSTLTAPNGPAQQEVIRKAGIRWIAANWPVVKTFLIIINKIYRFPIGPKILMNQLKTARHSEVDKKRVLGDFWPGPFVSWTYWTTAASGGMPWNWNSLGRSYWNWSIESYLGTRPDVLDGMGDDGFCWKVMEGFPIGSCLSLV